MAWTKVCRVDEIELEDVACAVIEGRDVAVYRDADGSFYASDAYCTHERENLCEGLLMDGIIECPRHGGQFRISDGKAMGPPVTVDVQIFPVKVEDDEVHVDVD